MGWWNAAPDGDSLQEGPTGLIWGDAPADTLCRAFMPEYGTDDGTCSEEFHNRLARELGTVRTLFLRDFGRLPTKQEMVAGVLFELREVRDFIRTLPDGPAPTPMQTFPGMLNVGPVSDAEVDGMREFMLSDTGEIVDETGE